MFDPDITPYRLTLLLDDAARKCQSHARHCHDCYHPIIDAEGNPGYLTEACITGYLFLERYIEIDAALRKLPPETPYLSPTRRRSK